MLDCTTTISLGNSAHLSSTTSRNALADISLNDPFQPYPSNHIPRSSPGIVCRLFAVSSDHGFAGQKGAIFGIFFPDCSHAILVVALLLAVLGRARGTSRHYQCGIDHTWTRQSFHDIWFTTKVEVVCRVLRVGGGPSFSIQMNVILLNAEIATSSNDVEPGPQYFFGKKPSTPHFVYGLRLLTTSKSRNRNRHHLVFLRLFVLRHSPHVLRATDNKYIHSYSLHAEASTNQRNITTPQHLLSFVRGTRRILTWADEQQVSC